MSTVDIHVLNLDSQRTTSQSFSIVTRRFQFMKSITKRIGMTLVWLPFLAGAANAASFTSEYDDAGNFLGVRKNSSAMAIYHDAGGKITSRSLITEGDGDGDGMSDIWEWIHGIDPFGNDAALDSDADGLTNLDEFNNNTNPTLADTDGDALNDGDEVALGTDPLDRDTDGDGLSDGWERGYGLDPLTDSRTADADGDGWTNFDEYLLESDPSDPGSTPDAVITHVLEMLQD